MCHASGFKPCFNCQAGVLQQLENLVIIGLNDGNELVYAEAPRKACEMCEQEGRRAAVLILVGDYKRDLGLVYPSAVTDEATDADERFIRAFANGDCEADMIDEIQLGEISQIVRSQCRFCREEAAIDRTGRKALKTDAQPRLVVGSDRAHANGRAVAQRAVSAKVFRVTNTT